MDRAHINRYRHDYNRKSSSFEDIDGPEIVVTQQDADAMGIYDADAIGVEDPFDDIPERLGDQAVFILRFKDALYLINTEGFSYCRYVAKCKIS
jgi:hypothetical protein